ncbi:alpha/beta hydrolase [Roseateles sp. DAIF2]|uniref:alpha/beta fold hydrolase n=1 Tax=Roseateles sp. DAIF2 TaxID=2714952 RepID=UPI0018A2822C|nr:alpha/beta hydrolase [Roseateles sp. DAIF2]QPF73647.1 alpha/beta hydrolase [Roseateles sp. DAIF2]
MKREPLGPGGWLLRLAGLLVLGLALGLAAFRAPERPLESLVARWAPPPSDFLDLDGQLVHYRDEGPRADPRPLLLLHGTGSSLHTWEGWAAALRAEGRRVITLDLPGFGLTGPSADGDYREAAYLDFLRRLLDRLQLPQVVLGGNSSGGQLAWRFAAEEPARVAALVLVDPAGQPWPGGVEPTALRLARLPGLELIASGLLPRRVVEQQLREAYGVPARLRAEVVDRHFELTLREGNRAALVQALRQQRPGQHLEQLGTLRQPTLILWGGRDRLLPPAQGEAFARAIPGSRLQVFEPLGHLPQEEDPATTVAALQQFLHSLKP